MERMNFMKNGICRLPPGFRFQPTDEELVFQYLKCKVLSCPLPTSIIPEVNVCNYDPWDLPGNCEEQERYFFSYKEAKYRNGNRKNRMTKSGYWKATGSDKKLSSPTNNTNDNYRFSGVRKTLVFHQGKAPNGSRTNWVMHEYRLVIVETSDPAPSRRGEGKEVGDWVVCRISMKTTREGGHVLARMKRRSEIDVVNVGETRFFDFMRVAPELHYSDTSSACSSSSDITEVCSGVAHHEETSGYSYSVNF